MTSYVPAVHPRWYDSFTDDSMMQGIVDALKSIERFKAKGYREDDLRIRVCRSCIAEFEHVLRYRGVSNVGCLIDPVQVFDLDTMTTWMEARP